MTLTSKEVHELQVTLETCQVALGGLLAELHAIEGAVELLGARNFSGVKILFKRYRLGFDEMKKRAVRLADGYDLLVDYIEAEERFVFDAKQRGRIRRIDKSASGDRERAATLVGKIVTLAKAQMLFSCDQDDRAIGALRSILSANEGKLRSRPRVNVT